MGCHTWAYKKLVDSDLDNTKAKFIKKLKESTYYSEPDELEKALSKYFRLCKEMYEDYKNIDNNVAKYYKRLAQNKELSAKRYMKKYNKLQKVIAEIESCSDINSLSQIYKKGKLNVYFLKDNLYEFVYFDHPLRVYGYPEEQFTKEDKFVKWLDETGRDYTKEDRENISKFWSEFENGVLLHFG